MKYCMFCGKMVKEKLFKYSTDNEDDDEDMYNMIDYNMIEKHTSEKHIDNNENNNLDENIDKEDNIT